MNFYQENILKIEELIKEKIYFKALDLIHEEFKVPYLPIFYEKKIKEFLNEIESKLQNQEENTSNDFVDVFSLSKIKEIILSEKLNQIHPFMILNLVHYNVELIIPFITIYLKSDKYTTRNKTFLLLFLQKQKINHTFILNKNNRLRKVNPLLLNKENLWKLYEETLSFLSQSFFLKEITINSFARDLLMDFYCFFYPFLPDFVQAKELACVIVFQTGKMLGKNWKKETLTNQFEIKVVLFNKVVYLFEEHFIF